MKKSLLLLGGVAGLMMLSGCASISNFVELPDLGSVKEAIQELGLPLGGVKLTEVKDAEGLKEDLPQALRTITIGGEEMNCQVTHLIVVDRDTNTTRQTDSALCQVVVEGDGIQANFQCTMEYTYTQNGGWGLADWDLETDQVTITMDDNAMGDQLARMNEESLEDTYGDGTVTLVESNWDGETQTCTQLFQVEAENGLMITSGTVVVDQVLTLDLDQGLYYTWESNTDESGVIHGADLTNTTWVAAGTIDGTQGGIAFHVDDFDMENGTALVTGVAEVTPEGWFQSTRNFNMQLATWEAQEDGTVILSITAGSHTWDCCFTEDKQWVRLDSSYLNTLTETVMPESQDLQEVLDEQEESASESDQLEYSANKTGQSYAATNGTTVYVQQVSYPVFTGTDAQTVNDLVDKVVSQFLENPHITTSQTYLDELAETAEDKGRTLPVTDELKISVEFNQNGYVSLLYTTTYRDSETGKQKTYSYDSLILDLKTGKEMKYTDFLTATSRQLGEVLVEQGGSSFPYTSSSVSSYIVAATLGRQGVEFYLSTNAKEATKVTVPYSEEIYTLNPTVKRSTETEEDNTSTTTGSWYSNRTEDTTTAGEDSTTVSTDSRYSGRWST